MITLYIIVKFWLLFFKSANVKTVTCLLALLVLQEEMFTV